MGKQSRNDCVSRFVDTRASAERDDVRAADDDEDDDDDDDDDAQ